MAKVLSFCIGLTDNIGVTRSVRSTAYFKATRVKIFKQTIITMSRDEIVLIIDKSGSMDAIKEDAIGGFNSFLAEQKNRSGCQCDFCLI